jgi:hypothetical protein
MGLTSRRWAFVALAALAGCAADQHGQAGGEAPIIQSSGNGMSFVSQAAGIRLVYPNSWHSVPGKLLLTLAPSGESSAGANTVVLDYPDIPGVMAFMVSLPAVENGFVNDLQKRYKPLTIEEKSDHPVAGVDGQLLRATGQRDSGPAVIVAEFLVRKGHVYVIDAETDQAKAASARAAFDMILKSLQWTD